MFDDLRQQAGTGDLEKPEEEQDAYAFKDRPVSPSVEFPGVDSCPAVCVGLHVANDDLHHQCAGFAGDGKNIPAIFVNIYPFSSFSSPAWRKSSAEMRAQRGDFIPLL